MSHTLRRTGRTTRLILSAALAVSEGKPVVILASSMRMAGYIEQRLYQLISFCDIPHERGRIWCTTPDQYERSRGHSLATVVLKDHDA